MLQDDELLVTNTGSNGLNGLYHASDLEGASEESNPSDAESISDTNNSSSVNNGKKIISSIRSTFNLSGAVKNMLQVQFTMIKDDDTYALKRKDIGLVGH